MTPADQVLAVESLSKTYISFKKDPGLIGGLKALVHRQKVQVPAVKSLNFSIARGEFVGLLGPNGAGKTSTLKMLTGLIRPSSGKATAFATYDTSLRASGYLMRIGMVMGQRNQLNPDLPAMDSFRLAQAIYGIGEERFKKRLDVCLNLFGVAGLVLTPVRKLSLGERMKMELILAILHEPELLFLDEPTIGLDFNAARQIRAFLGEANRTLGITVILTSHYTQDIEELCRRVILINHGSIVYDGALTGMDKRLQGQKVITLVFASPARAEAAATELAKLSAEGKPLSNCRVTTEDDSAETQVVFDTPVKDAAGITQLAISRIGAESVADLKIGERPLEQIFGEIYSQKAAAGNAL